MTTRSPARLLLALIELRESSFEEYIDAFTVDDSDPKKNDKKYDGYLKLYVETEMGKYRSRYAKSINFFRNHPKYLYDYMRTDTKYPLRLVFVFRIPEGLRRDFDAIVHGIPNEMTWLGKLIVDSFYTNNGHELYESSQ